jgi:hypothetical protein
MRTQVPPAIAGAEIAKLDGAFVLLAVPGTSLRVNGKNLIPGLRVLAHRDEIVDAAGAVAYFSTEDHPAAVRYAGPPAKCGRCHSSIAPEAFAVRCACGVWYHHGDGPSCFEYGDDPLCVACRRPARMDGSGLWSPEEHQ